MGPTAEKEVEGAQWGSTSSSRPAVMGVKGAQTGSTPSSGPVANEEDEQWSMSYLVPNSAEALDLNAVEESYQCMPCGSEDDQSSNVCCLCLKGQVDGTNHSGDDDNPDIVLFDIIEALHANAAKSRPQLCAAFPVAPKSAKKITHGDEGRDTIMETTDYDGQVLKVRINPKQVEGSRRDLKEEATSVEHCSTHNPKNIHCDACNRESARASMARNDRTASRRCSATSLPWTSPTCSRLV